MHHCSWAPAAASAGAGGATPALPCPHSFPLLSFPLLPPPALPISFQVYFLGYSCHSQTYSVTYLFNLLASSPPMCHPRSRVCLQLAPAHPGVTGASTVLPQVLGQPSRNVSHIWKCHLLTPSATRTRVTCPTLVRRSPHPQPQKGGNPEAYGCRSQLPTAAQPILDTPLCLPLPAAPPPIHQLPPDNTPSHFLHCRVPLRTGRLHLYCGPRQWWWS